MATLPIGIQTRSLRQPLRRALTMAAELGADGVEIDARNELRIGEFSQTALREFRRLLEELRLSVTAVSFPTRRGLGDAEELDRRVLAIREAMDFAYKIGAKLVVGRASDLPDASSTEYDILRESLTNLGAYGEHCGARYTLAASASVEQQTALVDQIGEGVVGLAIHPGMLIAAGQEPADVATQLGSRVVHLYAADAVRESTGGEAAETQLGRGEADLPAVLGTLEEHSYRGGVTIERRGGPNPLADIRDAVAFLRTI